MSEPRFALCIPTRVEEIDRILLSHRWWKEMPPFLAGAQNERETDLVYLAPGKPDEAFAIRVEKSLMDAGLLETFSSLRFHFADLEPNIIGVENPI